MDDGQLPMEFGGKIWETLQGKPCATGGETRLSHLWLIPEGSELVVCG